MWRQVVAVGAVMISAGLAQAADKAMPPEVARAWAKTGLPQSSMSMVIEEVGGDRLAGVNAAEFKNPASVMKLVTTWAALSELGPTLSGARRCLSMRTRPSEVTGFCRGRCICAPRVTP